MFHNPKLADTDDPNHHLIMGDIFSPSQTSVAANAMIDWIKGL